MSYIIGTAGHIDHGKTSLVKALTGQDTDRLKEEKARGISIELGFAYLDLPDGTRAGVVDVPGHERFIRTMLAGAHGIDLVLFTVAADDGVMPQTEEHLDILHLLGVRRAIFVVTKSDLASEDRLKAIEEDIAILTAGTLLDDSPTVRFSSVTGEGLETLRARIVETLSRTIKPEPQGDFRLPVDRVFVLQGHGLVVTGTATSGRVAVGDRVRCLPGGQLFRVRSLQVHNHSVEAATWGQRIALNLTGQERPSIERGQVICHESLTLTTNRFDAVLEMPPTSARRLRNHQRVRVHLGTSERPARVVLLAAESKDATNDVAFCQLAMTEPLLAMRGDHFVIRDETAQHTLGGGIVIHPSARKHKKAEPGLRQMLESLHSGTVAVVIETFLSERTEFAVSVERLRQFLNLPEDKVRAHLERLSTVRVFTFEGESFYASGAKWDELEQSLLSSLRDFHASHPLAAGMDMEEIRGSLPFRIAPRLFRAVVDLLTGANKVAREASLLRLPGHIVKLDTQEQDLAEKIRKLLGEAPLSPPDLPQLEQATGLGRARLAEVLRVMERERSIVKVTGELYFLSDSLERVKAALFSHFPERGEVTPAAFRELFGTSRKYAIPLLEYLDREGITVRVGDKRRLGKPSLIGR